MKAPATKSNLSTDLATRRASPVQDRFEPERYLAHRLREHGAELFDGFTDTTSRMHAARKAIVDNGLAAVVIGRHAGKPETYSQYFSRTYGAPL